MENSAQQNLELIATMIKQAQRRFYNDSPYYILWGSAVFLASLVQYFLILKGNSLNGLGWAIFIPAALVIQLFIIRKQKKEEQIKTAVESLLVSMWVAFGISIFIILLFSFKLQELTYPIVLCLYAFCTFIAGSAFKIKTFIFGAVACWIFAITAFFVSFEKQLLLLAAGVLFAFIIPGVILRSNEKTH